jgi:hypothetical protein
VALTVSFKRGVVAGAAALAIAGGAVGIAGAQQATQTPTPRTGQGQGQAQGQAQGLLQQRLEQYLSTLAGKLGIPVDKLRQAIDDTHKELGLPQRGAPGFGPFGGGRGPGGPGGLGSPGRPGGPGFPGPGFRGFGLDVAAQAIGITPDALRQELPGKSLTDVAKAHNVDPAKVAAALKTDANAKIDQAVANGRLTADQAAQAKQRAAEEIDQLMTRQLPTPPAPGQPGAQRQSGAQRQPGAPGLPGPRAPRP